MSRLGKNLGHWIAEINGGDRWREESGRTSEVNKNYWITEINGCNQLTEAIESLADGRIWAFRSRK